MIEKDEYIINKNTMSLIPKYNQYGNKCTVVYEKSNIYFVKQSPLNIVNESCSYYGSSYQGRVSASKKILKKDKMLPVEISHTLGIYFFPTISPKNPNCIWVSHRHIEKIERYNDKQTRMILTNRQPIILNIRKPRVEMKLNRTAQLIFVLETRNGYS